MSHIRQIATGPAVRPGEIWLVGQAAEADLAPLDRDAIASANVILYDRALERLIAEILPLGTYAEPLANCEPGIGSAISSRALRFAAEGWRVVQVVEARPGWRERVNDQAASLVPWGDGELPVVVIAKTSGSDRQHEANACDLAALIDGFAEDYPLTLIFGPLAARDPAPGQAFTANGLAG
jgi:hypothetical protein